MNAHKILLVDDNPTSLKLLKVAYESEGYEVVAASDGLEALEVLFQHKVDLILSDILMPNMDGYSLCYRVRTNENLRKIPIIIYTATYISASEEKSAKEMGANIFLRKPAPLKMLFAIVKEILADPEKYPGKIPSAAQSAALTQRYSEELVARLEESNIELNEAKQVIEKNNDEILRLNAELEERVNLRTEQLQAANKELEAFTYSVSHDLRAPLRIINGYGEILQENHAAQLDKEGQRALHSIITNTKKMDQLIADLLDLSKVGKAELRKTSIDMNRLVKEVLDELQLSGVVIPERLRIDQLKVAQGDAGLIRHVWANLLSNAIKYSGGVKSPEIEVGMQTVGDRSVYYVKDNGAGFDMQYYGKLFGVFQRLHGQNEFSGTGVGLAIVQRIITRHGGSVWAEAKKNEGATFYFTLD